MYLIVCGKRQTYTVNVNKSKVLMFKRSKSEMTDFECPYKLRVECSNESEIMEEVHVLKYLCLILCKH